MNKIDANTFQGLTKLKYLKLNNNNPFRLIDVNAFQGLSNLQDLRLINNTLRSIDAKTFQGLSKLTRLDLRFNKTFDRNALVGFIELEKGFFYDNPISNLLSGICAINIKCKVELSIKCF